MMHLERSKAERNIDFSATVSLRALNVAGTSLRDFFHQPGTSPYGQKIETAARTGGYPQPAWRCRASVVTLLRSIMGRRLRIGGEGKRMEWTRILAHITGTVDQELMLRNEYLIAENRILKAQLQGRPRLSNADRAKLSEIGH
jgi:hypothetical protein